MREFFLAALPWILMGLAVAIAVVRFSRGKRTISADEEDPKVTLDHTSEGMCLGICLGVAFGAVAHHLALGLSFGMLLGMAVGANIKKK